MSNYPFVNREISWLYFNERVLREAEDDTVPVLEKLKFAAIFSSNLDEFFMIRVAGLKDQVAAGYQKIDISGQTPNEILTKISTLTHDLVGIQRNIFNNVKNELEKENILLAPQIDNELEEAASAIFTEEIAPVITPVTHSQSNPFPFIYNLRLCVIVELEKGGETFYSFIIIPENLRRLYKVTLNKTYFLTVEQLIAYNISTIFPDYKVKNTYVIRVTRNADLDVEAEESQDLLNSIKKQLNKRRKGSVVRIELDRELPNGLYEILSEIMQFDHDDIYLTDGILDLTCMFAVTGVKESLCYPVYKAPVPEDIPMDNKIFDRIKAKDIILYRPFQSYATVSKLISIAADDLNVLSIKLTLYRANTGSSIIESLTRAARNGKQVSAVVELKARFDEEKNLEWARLLEDAGCIVTYGIPSLKIHTKNLLIVRKENGSIVRYSHLSTGNYNEATAKLYTDIDYITADQDVGRETSDLFNLLMGYTDYAKWDRLSLAPKDLKPKIFELINTEIENAKKGKKAVINVKINSLIDKMLMSKIYEASEAGVKINMVIRGICGIKTGVKGVSENVTVKSIVGRFLEHPRILYFYADGDERVFISTADWMERNMDRRVENLFEIKDKDCKRNLIQILENNLKDTEKSWVLKGDVYYKEISKPKNSFNSQKYYIKKYTT